MYMSNTSLVNDVVELVVAVRRHMAVLSAMRDTHIEKSRVLDMLEDVVCHSAGLMSSMLASPLTGRMFIEQDIGVTVLASEQNLTDTLIYGK